MYHLSHSKTIMNLELHIPHQSNHECPVCRFARYIRERGNERLLRLLDHRIDVHLNQLVALAKLPIEIVILVLPITLDHMRIRISIVLVHHLSTGVHRELTAHELGKRLPLFGLPRLDIGQLPQADAVLAFLKPLS